MIPHTLITETGQLGDLCPNLRFASDYNWQTTESTFSKFSFENGRN